MAQAISATAPGLLAGSAAAQVEILPLRGRLSLRARKGLPALGKALGLTLPRKIGGRKAAKGREVLCLGPDEWVILLPYDELGAAKKAAAALYDTAPHALVDISARELSVAISGPRASELLSLGCPRDMRSLPEGEGRRTVFDGASVVLWRDGVQAYRMDIWTSFAPHLAHLFVTGCRELAADPS